MLLRHAWLPLGLVLAVGGLVAGAGPVLTAGLFVLLAGVLARVWADRSLEQVRFERLLPERRAFPGESLRLTYRLTNGKLIPLTRIELRDRLPKPLTPYELDLPPADSPQASAYAHTTHLGWHERTSWSFELPCPERGYYRLGPARLRSGDGFGLFSNERDEPATDGVVVYPRTVSLPDLGLPAERPLGEQRGRRRIFEDPMLVAGVRDYQPGDGLRRINWMATAHTGRLQSRVYEPSTTQHLIVALNVDTLEISWQGYIPEVLEASITVAASVARWAYDERYSVGLLANGGLPESDQAINIAASRAPDQLGHILEALGGIGPMTMTSLADLLDRESHSLPFGATIAVVTTLMPNPLAAAIRRLHNSERQVVVLSLGDGAWPDQVGSVLVRQIDWRSLTLGAPAPPAAGPG